MGDMDAWHWLPFVSTLITVGFAVAVFRRYSEHRRPQLLWWGLGLALYALGTFAEAYLAVGWSAPLLRLWYLSGAMLTAAWLGQGTLALLIRKPVVIGVLNGVLLGASLVAAAAVFLAPLHAAAYQLGLPVSSQYKAIMDRTALMIGLTILLNIYGTIALVGGALWSAWLFFRKRVLFHRVVGNVLIAAGAMLPAGAGTFIRLGLGDYLYVSELLGATLMFAGFWWATQRQPADQPRATRQAAHSG